MAMAGEIEVHASFYNLYARVFGKRQAQKYLKKVRRKKQYI